jgi:uncharacterized membrane protein YhhN
LGVGEGGVVAGWCGVVAGRLHAGDAEVYAMTLTEFLLARIAEDEALCRNTMGVPEWWPARVLAECGAKRRILAHATRPEHQSWESPMVSILAAMVLPYVDHPDCREAWAVLAEDA